MLIRVLKKHPHNGQYRSVGSVYDCPVRKAQLLIVIGKAEKHEEKKAPAKRGPGRPRKTETQDAKPKRGPGRPRKTETAGSDNQYATKVLTAED